MNIEKSIGIILKALEDNKALDVIVFEVSKLTSISDYMIIASGRSSRQVNSIAEKVTEAAKGNGLVSLGTEGKKEGDWVLVDLGDIIVHIMHPDTREYYQLEKLWSAETIEAEQAENR
ncbi:ribosome silencing factor [Gammaproteobacteria bacterium]|jgi:ribosome-associated protein|nr:ribosome silencing factor [Gammaproteobacteria bacterium]|tara:strand:+ start:106 stop:459 length:354 start_codon:yes stop_codon:yes gene_type:complete